MKNIIETLFCWCVVAILTGTSLAEADQSLDEGSRDDADSKRGWNMLRLGRGLQMLRLGKRSANLDSLGFWRHGRNANTQVSAELLNALAESMFDQPRDETRRQPPLPRYGRDSGSSIRYLVDANSDVIGANPFELYPMSNPRSFFRPAPRGGRYRRSPSKDKLAFEERFSPRDSARTGAFPSTEETMNQAANLQSQRLSGSRVGSNQNEASDDSNQQMSV
ncbi:hypothetical protein BsWGS_18763 [Bradybaena similaris]